ncbi:MAG: hypothetical protein J6S69_07905 [Proteobacteria bacterium]|nr:hypothetical protein [Pseudomonadota bacterium]
MRKSLLFCLALFLTPGFASAQEAAAPAPAPAPAPAAAAAPAEAVAAPEVPAQPKSDDPGDVIANYFTSMADLVAQNMDTPAALLEKFSAYIAENEKSMRKASKAFEDKMTSLKANEAEVYRETVQRKITPALNKLISLLIDFQSRYPTEAAKLDSMLKVDAKYTYQQ